MPDLGAATGVRVGATAATRVYMGGTQVWPTAAPVPAQFVGYSNNKGFTATNTVPPVTGVQDGDTLVAYAAGNDQAATITPPAGWTLLTPTPAASGNVRARVYCRTAASEGTTVWTWPGSHNHEVVIVAWRGYQLPTTAVTAVTTGTATVNAPTMTTSGADALLVCSAYRVTYGATPTFAGMTTRFPGAASGSNHFVADETRPTPGATGTRAFTQAATSILLASSLILERAA